MTYPPQLLQDIGSVGRGRVATIMIARVFLL